MKKLLWYVSCCLMPMFGASATHASPEVRSSANTATGNAASLGKLSSIDRQQTFTATPMVASDILAQVPPPPPTPTEVPSAPPTPSAPTTPATPETPATPGNSETQDIKRELDTIKNQTEPGGDKFNSYQPKSSPAFSIFNPVGFGADKNLVFLSVSYQNRTRFTQTSDGEAGIGIGLGDAVNSVGAELTYSLNSFGSSAGFGSGGFSAKLHKRIGEDTAVAIGWNQFAKIQLGGGRNGNGPSDYPNNSYYAVGTKILRTREDINDPFSRLALTAGVGSGVFLPFDRNGGLDRSGLNVFGSVGVRVARPVSAVVEWTGQDLAAGVSVAPFENFPLVITPAVRDITGAGDGARFVLGASVSFNF
ncbi:hypothetical protein [Chamaesiphon sp. VAR_48_metabat_403]|uniref:hypothetical protein n=1 Tax=Chamaesiphon sp. VAR_48_metabat_403 TaxID=2964700 RepID=UPI00286E1849|nr:hypothetical protein [Chamaesiphon sp. VAR_48_metabat_403]